MSALGGNDLAFAIVLGSALGVGVCLLLSLAPRWGAPSLANRIAPYIRDVTDPRGLGLTPAPVRRDAVLAWQALQTRFAQAAGGDASISRRLRQAGWPTDAAAFRGRQLAWAIAGLGVGGLVVVAAVLLGRGSASLAMIPPLCAVGAALGFDAWLSRAARARVARIQEELPTVLEFLALCLSAGEGILDSLRRVSDVGAGELTAELRGVVVAVGTGSSLPEALTTLARRLQISALARTVDQLVAAIDRGAPLAQVLHAQALDAREDAKRDLIERAGRKEIYMLVPLVFLILPLSVLFAVFPGVFMLRLGIA
ncbi:type II secretion system F family protein [Microbacterium sp. CFBP9034]|uniref:type II secretion system F family protein n=1 Tax=Microbacterium sp. CFBP9034 TaxID=3096540 RepID=UPI002A6AACE1|nr:type II secretion system F family protein [Microbacterium sp. CFBP9034]MDY0909357.1 type II secretion system F family protein [Microbacterium sp. CFBP9034]